MASVFRFKKRHQPSQHMPWDEVRRSRNHWSGRIVSRWGLIVIVAAFGALGLVQFSNVYDQPFKGSDTRKRWYGSDVSTHDNRSVISCFSPHVIDGDTFTCDGIRIRLASIDAPEMPGHCRPGRSCTAGDPFASLDYLRHLSSGHVTCHSIETDTYGRTVARCEAGGKDLSCEMVKANHAVKRYGSLSCEK